MRGRIQATTEFLVATGIVGALLAAAWSVWLPVRVLGGSMSPALSPGDLVIVARNARPREGHIVLARSAGRGAVLHRVVAIGDDGLVTTRGDANAVDDAERIRAAEVAGVVVRVIPIGTLLRRWRGVAEVGYHDGSTEQHEATTETTSGEMQSEQGWVRQQVRGPSGLSPGGSLQQLRPERSSIGWGL